MVRSVRGSFHQGCLRFQSYNGMQCTAIALIALLSLMNRSSFEDFSQRIIDDIWYRGTSLYVERTGVQGCLGHRHMPRKVNSDLGDRTIHLNYLTDVLSVEQCYWVLLLQC